jgi:hypothetical protein
MRSFRHWRIVSAAAQREHDAHGHRVDRDHSADQLFWERLQEPILPRFVALFADKLRI